MKPTFSYTKLRFSMQNLVSRKTHLSLICPTAGPAAAAARASTGGSSAQMRGQSAQLVAFRSPVDTIVLLLALEECNPDARVTEDNQGELPPAAALVQALPLHHQRRRPFATGRRCIRPARGTRLSF